VNELEAALVSEKEVSTAVQAQLARAEQLLSDHGIRSEAEKEKHVKHLMGVAARRVQQLGLAYTDALTPSPSPAHPLTLSPSHPLTLSRSRPLHHASLTLSASLPLPHLCEQQLNLEYARLSLALAERSLAWSVRVRAVAAGARGTSSGRTRRW
jgi:hypothetical protein